MNKNILTHTNIIQTCHTYMNTHTNNQWSWIRLIISLQFHNESQQNMKEETYVYLYILIFKNSRRKGHGNCEL